MLADVPFDMAGSMNLIAKKCFYKTEIVTHKFHFQKLASEAVQEERIWLRWEVIELDNTAIQKARENGKTA
jgi:transposase